MALKGEILEKIIQRAAELFKKNPGELNADTRFVEDLKAKSVNYVQKIAVLEDEFDVSIDFMQFRSKATIRETAEYISNL